jgi:hypothetical protein
MDETDLLRIWNQPVGQISMRRAIAGVDMTRVFIRQVW